VDKLPPQARTAQRRYKQVKATGIVKEVTFREQESSVFYDQAVLDL